MSWHTNAILIRRDFSDDPIGLLDRLDLHDAKLAGTTSFDEAASSSNEGIALAFVDGWTTLWGSVAIFMVSDEELVRISKDADVFTMTLEGASGTAGFACYQGGKLVRDWMRQEDAVVKDEGKPLPQEKAAFAKRDDEQAVLQILEKLTIPLDKLDAATFRMYEVPDLF
ncbi:MAG: hypothetical protein K2X38_16435 [Gemmataceae bacterium]|nr:hypothetical protein [Gemmataceae bacterium]